ncbi:MAG: family 78 glycoside hydrolase catalytic domain [Bacteroidales bacterium]|nr:family 78 glycoside hydrolase catalytic domain [Bacteroidales bacterium]
MKIITLFILPLIILISCKNIAQKTDQNDTWEKAQWIGLEKIEDSLRVVPGIHGFKRILKNKYTKRSTVPLFRKVFKVDKTIDKATINISGLGHYELYINGNKVGDRFLSPGWSYYDKHVLYNTFDITAFLKNGENTLGAIVGNGFYNVNNERYRKLVIAYGYPKVIFNIRIKYTDGSIKNTVSDEQCKVSPSPITYSSIFGGEDYDATLEQKGWSKSEFDDSKWKNSIFINDSTSMLIPEKDFPLKVMQEFKVQAISKSKTGKTIYDFGQNASGIISIKVKGNKGAQVRILPDELINEDGNVTQRSGGGPYEFNYTLKGEGIEEWQPRFTYYGFRYAEVEVIEPKDAKKKTEVLELKLLHTRNSSPTVGSFSCSDTLFNQFFELINWGIKSNMASVATDCPHREKLGWLEQTYLIGPSMHYNYDIHALYSKIVDDMMDSQLENGLVPDIAPEYVAFTKGFRDSPEWGSASVIIPWQLYQWYGDKKVIKKAYPMMKSYVDYLQTKLQNNMLTHGLGDWFDLGPNEPGEAQLTPKAVTATSIYYYDLQIITKIAEMMGYKEDLEKYKSLSENIKDGFLKEFYNHKAGIISTGSQTAYAISLYTGLIPDADKEKVFNNLVNSIKNNDYALTSGDIGYHFLVRVLSENGRSDILYKMNNRSDRPGYGYQLKKGATSLTESWSALTHVSNNHMMLGHLMEWFYTGLGGIYQDKNSIAYEEIIIAPKPVGDIKWVKCSFDSPKGIISSQWIIKGNSFNLNVEVPENSVAKIIIPENFKKTSYKILDLNSQSIIDVKITDGVFKITPGKYEIIAK